MTKSTFRADPKVPDINYLYLVPNFPVTSFVRLAIRALEIIFVKSLKPSAFEIINSIFRKS
jgi:hypothetical protein